MNHVFTKILEDLNRLAAKDQKCKRKAVGCGLVEFNLNTSEAHLVAIGVNGPSSGECNGEVGKCGCSHAEPRAIMSLMRQNIHSKHLMICSYSPCTNCANIIVDSQRVNGVVYGIFTDHDPRGVEILRRAGIPVYALGDLIPDSVIEGWIYGTPRR